MPALSLAQTLHGYDGGHRLLAAGGDVDTRELAILDRLSDLSGYLPPGTTFDSYWTGFPCGRHYAFACTWLDSQAARGGTVLTHTLLVPLSALGELSDLWTLATSFRRPATPADRSLYERSLVISISSEQHPRIHRDRALDVIALFFGQTDRPILWLDDLPPDDVIRFLWGVLWPEARRAFAFCTFALQARSIDKRPFDFLALPESARGAFQDRSGSSGWWDRGNIKPAARAFSTDPWTATVVDTGTAALGPVLALAEAHSLPIPKPSAFREAQRFLDLAPAASRELTAARARVDLLSWLWPEIPPLHPLAREVLDSLLRHQASAPLTPQPLRELRDVVSRKLVTDRAEADAAFARRVEETLRDEVGSRLAKEPDRVPAELPALLDSASSKTWRAAILKGALIPGAGVPDREHRLRAVVKQIPEDKRTTVLQLAESVAFEARDVTLAFCARDLQGDPAGGLRAATEIAMTSAVLDKIRDLAEVSARAPRPLAVERLKEEPRIALPFVRLTLREGPPAALFLDSALAALPLHDALSEELREDLARSSVSWSAPVADHLVSPWIHAVGEERLPTERAAPWLLVSPFRDALRRAGPDAFPRDHRDVGPWLASLARVVSVSMRTERRAEDLVEALLGRPLDEARANHLEDATAALTALLDAPLEPSTRHVLAARTLEAVRRTSAGRASALVERAFPVVYPTLVSERGGGFSLWWPLAWFTGSWDRAKPWRAWLAETWLRNAWPADGFLRCLGDDRALFRRLVRRLARTPDGLRFIEKLPRALDTDRSLRDRWADEIARALDDPRRDVDYE